jgi:hypothetical protein
MADDDEPVGAADDGATDVAWYERHTGTPSVWDAATRAALLAALSPVTGALGVGAALGADGSVMIEVPAALWVRGRTARQHAEASGADAAVRAALLRVGAAPAPRLRYTWWCLVDA